MLSLFALHSASGQCYVNSECVRANGQPAELNCAASVTDEEGHLGVVSCTTIAPGDPELATAHGFGSGDLDARCLGKKVRVQRMQPGADRVAIGLAGLPQGHYTAQLVWESQLQSLPFIIY